MTSRFFFKFSSLKSFRSGFGAIGAALLLCPLLVWVQSGMELPSVRTDTQPKPYSAPFYKFISIGYSPAVVDWMWIETLQLIGNRKYPPSLKPVARSVYDLATDLDPKFTVLYEHGGVLFSVLFHSTDDAIYFLEKGIRNGDPGSSHYLTLHLLLFTQYVFGKKDWAKAKEVYVKAAELPGAPAGLQNVKNWLMEKDGEKKLARQVLKVLINTTDDEFLKNANHPFTYLIKKKCKKFRVIIS